MRAFTKEHNDIEWLFSMPMSETGLSIDYSNRTFDDFEEWAEYYFNVAYKDRNSFDKDDMIDAFMKGASVCHQRMNQMIRYYVEKQEYEKLMRDE